MGEMKSSRQTEASLKSSSQQLANHNIGEELTSTWRSLSQSKAALRHIENRLEATSGTGVLLDSVMDPSKKMSSKMVRCRDGQQSNDKGGSSNHRGGRPQNLGKSSSRSPLRNTTQDSNVRRNNSVDFKEPLVSNREATPPLHPTSQLESYSLLPVSGSLRPSSPPASDLLLSQLISQRDNRVKQMDRDLDSTHASALESTEVRYLNDQPALVTLRAESHLPSVGVPEKKGGEELSTPKAQPGMESQESSPFVVPAPDSMRRGESSPSSSPGSASQRLENLKRHHHDDKLEKLKERIRRQRQHLEEAAKREKLLGYLEQPVIAAVARNNDGATNMPTAKIRKVAAAPPAPIYKGFNSTETKIQTPDGKVWKEEEFHNLSREIYRDLSQQFAECTRSRHQQQRERRADRSKERRPPKPVRKVHKVAPSTDLNAKPVISPASWREGQKLVTMVLGPVPKMPKEDRPQPADGQSRTASRHRSSSDSRSELKQRSRPHSTERTRSGFRGQSKNHSKTTPTPSSADQGNAPVGVGPTNLLSADIQDILDDLQLEYTAVEKEEMACQRSQGGRSGRRGRGESGSRTRTPFSAWKPVVTTGGSQRGWRSASPTTRQPETAKIADAGHKKRHYDADTVRQYISRQQEERKRREAEEKRALREEAETRTKRLQELYRKQREMAKTVAPPSEDPMVPVQRRLQETYNKLLQEGAQLGEEATQMQPAAPSSQMRPMYQPSGESDKENKRLEAPQSPSSSDRSLNDQLPPPLTRDDLDVQVSPWLQPDRLSPAVPPMTGSKSAAPSPFGDHFLSHLLRLETAMARSEVQQTQRPGAAPANGMQPKMSRIEALKATAASLSNRIENEARKLAGQGINYGAATAMDTDTVLAPGPSPDNFDGRCLAEAGATENHDVALRIHRILTSTGYSSYNGATLPGAGNLHAHRAQMKTKGTRSNLTNAQMTSAVEAGPLLDSYTRDGGKSGNSPVNDLEKGERTDKTVLRSGNGLMEDKNRTDLHDSSAGSISEGPILSEGSLSEEEASPPHPTSNLVPRPADRVEAVAYCGSQRKDYQRLSEFQREAAMCSALSSPFAQHNGSNAAWEELNKGSPLSVINIFTKNLHGHGKVSEGNSPSAHSLHSGNDPVDAAIYEDDFVSSHSSGASSQLKRGSNSRSVSSHFEELLKRSPYEKSNGGIDSHHSSLHSSHRSSGSPSGSSPFSNYSAKKRGTASDQSDATIVEEQRSSCSPPSEPLSSDFRSRGSDRSSAHSHAKSVHSNDILEGPSHQSKKITAARLKLTSPSDSPSPGSSPGADSRSEPIRSGSLGKNKTNTSTTACGSRVETKTTGELQYSPAVLQQRMAAELHYLESIEESVRQLGDVERLMGVSMAQQESVSLAQILKAKQQRHERDLYELKIKAEREALETQLQLEGNRQRFARAHIELQGSLAGAQRETLEGLQEATTKMMSQQAEAAQYTADAARQLKEMTALARSHVEGAFVVPAVATEPSMLKEEEDQSSYIKQQQDKIDSDSFQSEVSNRRMSPNQSSLNSPSHSDTLSFRRPKRSGADSSSHHSLSHVSSDHREQMKEEMVTGKLRKGAAEERAEREAGSTSIEDEVLTAANDSLYNDNIPSIANDKADSTSVATECSLKFDESMTEDEIEERSFRCLLPSEAHRRGSKEKSRHHEESEDGGANHSASLVSGAHNVFKSQDTNMAFSSGQDSFSQFTMDMVRQYMKDEEVRLQHQSSLLRLRQKALKEKTRTELAWLEHQKKRLRDKGEDDKMPPIRKKQRGLLMKLQQEQAEIKRLQEANKAARKERQLLLKQQEEIERMRNSTLRLKERLKCAGGEPQPEGSVSQTPVSEAAFPNTRHAEDVRSPSPSLSISGSETSSIMQKLKKMRSHMDEKFLTKREQQLMQRRHHAVELLQWKQRLDQEEVEVRRIEKEALAVWDRQMPMDKEMAYGQKTDVSDISSIPYRSSEPRTDTEKEYVSGGNSFSATPESSIHTEGPECLQTGSPSSVQAVSISEKSSASVQSSPANNNQDLTPSPQSPSRQSLQSPFKWSHSPAVSPSDGSRKTKMQLCSSSRNTNQPDTEPNDSPIALHTEPISDQSDIESRVKALREEVRKRKFVAYQLKKEQKKRHKERLKAQEASLLKQLQSYDDFIEKATAEMNKEPDTPETTSQIKDSTSNAKQPSIKTPANRAEANEISDSKRMQIDASLDHNVPTHRDHSRSTSVPEELSEDPATITPTPVNGIPAFLTSGPQSPPSTERVLRPSSKEAETQMIESEDKDIESQRSEIQEELEEEVTLESEDQCSEHLLKLEKEDGLDSQEKLFTYKHVSSSMSEEHCFSPSGNRDPDKQMTEVNNSKVEEAVKTHINSSNKSHSAVDPKISPHPSYSPSSRYPSCSPDSVDFAPKEALIQDEEGSIAIADHYPDDFESSVYSSPRDDHSSKLASYISASPTEIKSQDEEVEEEIAEELSYQSGTSGASHQSGRLLNHHHQREDSYHDGKDIVNFSHSPAISTLKPPLSPAIDEMSSFNIGDRVLIGCVQPGTLRFKGPTSFANGFWAGVELDKSEGSNNGTYDGVIYFECDENHGIFAPPEKVTHLPDKLEVYTDNTEDDKSFFDDLPDNFEDKRKTDEEKSQKDLRNEKEQTSHKFYGSRDEKVSDESGCKVSSHLNSQYYKESKDPIFNVNTEDIILDFKDAPTTLVISDVDIIDLESRSQKKITSRDETEERDSQPQFTPADLHTDVRDKKEDQKDRVVRGTFVDQLLDNFVKDTVKQFAKIKKSKEQKIEAANGINGDIFGENGNQQWFSSVEQKDGLPFFLPAEQEELSSPELCNRPESPVLGASGQEKLAKRLAELELSRELLDDLGDDQDWFDEDFGLSSRREQQRLKLKIEEEARLGGGGGMGKSASSAGTTLGGLVSSGGEQQVKTPPRPEIPLPPKLPEQPAMVVPHSAIEVEKLVHAATQEIWESCSPGKEGTLILAHLPTPKPSQEYLGKEANSQDLEAACIRSYRKAVFYLTWEMLQEIFAEDPSADQPQWLKPRRVKSSSHRVKTPVDVTKIQEFITAEVLKLYGLRNDHTQKTDWQKMLKFGRKKRDRVDHILVQELHEEENQWVYYDEDELFVKMQLADSIFDSLLKDTANMLTVIYDNRAQRDTLS